MEKAIGAEYLPPEIEKGLRAENIPPLQKNAEPVTFVTFCAFASLRALSLIPD
ncbi:hypothetical protein KL86DYS1_30141 [uncultured Dysgonomonas sp.]|uniref:Uncharacterized protein n=1 Tax=uncultured Dysgonomonas sp. TaxID=206096 RepID=A0A212JR83_9BACT|nr:hypothetical protein KL86DYS1_30141 [uncultured Dysgonomonas sp.]